MIEKDILKILTNLDRLDSKVTKFIKEVQDDRRKKEKVKTVEKTYQEKCKVKPKRKKGRPKSVKKAQEIVD